MLRLIVCYIFVDDSAVLAASIIRVTSVRFDKEGSKFF